MRKLTYAVLVGIVVSCLGAEPAPSEETPEGKVYVYKKVDGVAQEAAIHFPKDHDLSTPVPGIITFHGGAWKQGDRIQG